MPDYRIKRKNGQRRRTYTDKDYHKAFESDAAWHVIACKKQYIYFIWAIGSGSIKIGQSYNPWSRIHELSTACPHELALLAVTPVTAKVKEFRMHNAFSHLKVDKQRTEWFYAEDDLLDFINHINDKKDPVEFLEKIEERRGLYQRERELVRIEEKLFGEKRVFK